jgi:hypothetical protein
MIGMAHTISRVTMAHLEETYVKMPPAVFQLCHVNRPDAPEAVAVAAAAASAVADGVAAAPWKKAFVELTEDEFIASVRVGSAIMLPGPRILPKRSSRP